MNRPCEQPERAKELFAEMRARGFEPTIRTYGALLTATASASTVDIEWAFSLVDQVVRVKGLRDHGNPSGSSALARPHLIRRLPDSSSL